MAVTLVRAGGGKINKIKGVIIMAGINQSIANLFSCFCGEPLQIGAPGPRNSSYFIFESNCPKCNSQWRVKVIFEEIKQHSSIEIFVANEEEAKPLCLTPKTAKIDGDFTASFKAAVASGAININDMSN